MFTDGEFLLRMCVSGGGDLGRGGQGGFCYLPFIQKERVHVLASYVESNEKYLSKTFQTDLPFGSTQLDQSVWISVRTFVYVRIFSSFFFFANRVIT